MTDPIGTLITRLKDDPRSTFSTWLSWHECPCIVIHVLESLPPDSMALFVTYPLRDYASHAERFAWRQHPFFGSTNKPSGPGEADKRHRQNSQTVILGD